MNIQFEDIPYSALPVFEPAPDFEYKHRVGVVPLKQGLIPKRIEYSRKVTVKSFNAKERLKYMKYIEKLVVCHDRNFRKMLISKAKKFERFGVEEVRVLLYPRDVITDVDGFVSVQDYCILGFC